MRKHNGDILVYVSTACSKTVTVWKCPVDGTRLWLKLADLGGRKPLYVCIAYAPPQNSPYADKDLFEAIAQEVVEVESLEGTVLLVGDFNARTRQEPDFVDCTSLCDVLQIPELLDTRPSPRSRQNRDTVASCGWHKELLGLCCATGYRILNGRVPGDLEGECTCLANQGHSTVDYILACPDLLDAAHHLEVLTDSALCGSPHSDSDHRPLVLQFAVITEPLAVVMHADQPHMIRFKYNPALSNDYCTKLQDRISTINLNACIEDMSVAALSELIHDNICMVANEVFGQKQPPSAHHHCHKPWFDSECRVQKKQVRIFLREHPNCELARHLQKNLK